MKGFQTNCRFVMEIVFFASKRVIDIQEVKGIDLNCQLSLHLSFLKNLRRVSEQLWREYYGMSLHGLKWRVFNYHLKPIKLCMYFCTINKYKTKTKTCSFLTTIPQIIVCFLSKITTDTITPSHPSKRIC